METIKFKTTIKCMGCVAQATPYLNEAVGENNWQVDVKNPDKVLTVSTDEKVNEEVVMEAIQKAGYKAEKLV